MHIYNPLETTLVRGTSTDPRLKVKFNDLAPRIPLPNFSPHSHSLPDTYGCVTETRLSAYVELLLTSTSARVAFKALPRLGISPADQEAAHLHLDPAYSILSHYHPTIVNNLSNLSTPWEPYELGPLIIGQGTKYIKDKGHKFYRAQWELSFSTPGTIEPSEHNLLLHTLQQWLQNINTTLLSNQSPYQFLITEVTTGETLCASRSRKYLFNEQPEFDPD